MKVTILEKPRLCNFQFENRMDFFEKSEVACHWFLKNIGFRATILMNVYRKEQLLLVMSVPVSTFTEIFYQTKSFNFHQADKLLAACFECWEWVIKMACFTRLISEFWRNIFWIWKYILVLFLYLLYMKRLGHHKNALCTFRLSIFESPFSVISYLQKKREIFG